MKPSTALLLGGVALALAACNAPDQNRTTSVPRGVNNPTAITAPIVTPSAPPAPAERGPTPANANAAAPGTNAMLAFTDQPPSDAKSLPGKGGAPTAQEAAVAAQEAAAKAPDTAAADAAKDQGMEGQQGARPQPAERGRETSINEPRHGALTKEEESTQMPKAGQTNNYNSLELEKDSGRPSR
jgi:hypothetical protein